MRDLLKYIPGEPADYVVCHSCFDFTLYKNYRAGGACRKCGTRLHWLATVLTKAVSVDEVTVLNSFIRHTIKPERDSDLDALYTLLESRP